MIAHAAEPMDDSPEALQSRCRRCGAAVQWDHETKRMVHVVLVEVSHSAHDVPLADTTR